MKITVVGSSYVGLSLATLLSQNINVTIYDIDKNRINKINKRESTVVDSDIEYFFKTKKLLLNGTTDCHAAFENSTYIIICTSTNYNENTGELDTSSVDDVLHKIEVINKDAIVIIKSTIPIGFTENTKNKYKIRRIIFSPEFLREGYALHDNLYPSRIIVGDTCNEAKKFFNILKKIHVIENPRLFL